MQNLQMLLCTTTLLISALTLLEFITNSASAIPPDYIDDTFRYGPLMGATVNDNGEIDWVMTGNWRSSLSDDPDTTSNITQNNNQSSGIFTAAIEMIKSDGTARHTHTLTDFVVLNTSTLVDNSTIFNGTTSISLQEGPVVDVPTTIQKSSNGNLYIIMIDPANIDYHFGESYLIYGINSNAKFATSSSSNNSYL